MQQHRLNSDIAESDDSVPLRELHRIIGGLCADCHTTFSAREAVCSIALGFKNVPRCVPCLSLRLDRNVDDFRTQLLEYVLRRECYTKAWREAERMDGSTDWVSVRSLTTTDPSERHDPVPFTEQWDAGDMGCGELVMALRMRLNTLAPGTVIKVTATDTAAPEDLPAWCRLTGHTLRSFSPPHYFIQRKGS